MLDRGQHRPARRRVALRLVCHNTRRGDARLVVAPLAELVVDGLPVWIVLGQHAPRRARYDQIQGGMPILTDNIRKADPNNPNGYYEMALMPWRRSMACGRPPGFAAGMSGLLQCPWRSVRSVR
jgi:hypothetical protein